MSFEILDIVIKRLDQVLRGRELNYDEFSELAKSSFKQAMRLKRDQLPSTIMDDLAMKAISLTRKF